MENLVPIASMISALTGVCTFAFAVFIAWQASRIHNKTDELVVHTNSLTDKLMEKTDTAARAEGMREGVAQQLAAAAADPAAARQLAKETAEAAALIIRVAAEQAAAVLTQAAKTATAAAEAADVRE